MNGNMSAEALEFGEVTAGALEALGGLDLLRAAVRAPAGRIGPIDEALAGLGVWDLRPGSDEAETEAAAAVCRAAGWVALPYPVAERLAGNGTRALTPLPGTGAAFAAHVDVPLGWTGVRLDGTTASVTPTTEVLGGPLGAFVHAVGVGADGDPDPAAAALLVTLQSWWLLGLLDRALSDTRRYTGEREQFGHLLQHFQTVGFRLADMTVAVNGLEELAKYTLWSQSRSPARSRSGSAPAVRLADALALRVAALEAADVVLRGAHQLHGAMGFCDETDVSWLSRASQAVRRLPEGQSQTVRRLTVLATSIGLDGPFSDFDAA
ncbi:acyl-CoA dehydrogenase [Nakamurella sp. YIM 132087]|uniref:Acyl-CoA dehydrogenase n=1 Tax=Nakamurella alba TaxID=2665158 RepID=A0A7K1FQ94_9ACTN|nr:acyl-CoA dehydrogenase family protein [Nakamurella alba]MTD16317.1 acyl-CoA dehydrogenase [Nakamurella alba]